MKDLFDDSQAQELYLDPVHKKIGGVCAGVARYLDVPRFWVRIAAVIGLFIHPPTVLIAYGLAYIILDEAPDIYDEVIPREEFTD